MASHALLFDMDGTLTDSDPFHLEAFAEVAARYGVLIDEEVFRKYVSGQTNALICRTLFPHVDVSEHKAIADEKEALFRRLVVGRLEPIAGVVDLLDRAAANGCGLAMVSNAPRANIETMLAELHLADRFDAVVIGSELPRGKPDPLPYLTGMERLGVVADRSIAFEDAPPGLASAVAAGIVTVGMTTTLSPAEIRSTGATLAVPDYRAPELTDLIAARFGW